MFAQMDCLIGSLVTYKKHPGIYQVIDRGIEIVQEKSLNKVIGYKNVVSLTLRDANDKYGLYYKAFEDEVSELITLGNRREAYVPFLVVIR